jgi:hypothetical protein
MCDIICSGLLERNSTLLDSIEPGSRQMNDDHISDAINTVAEGATRMDQSQPAVISDSDLSSDSFTHNVDQRRQAHESCYSDFENLEDGVQHQSSSAGLDQDGSYYKVLLIKLLARIMRSSTMPDVYFF